MQIKSVVFIVFIFGFLNSFSQVEDDPSYYRDSNLFDHIQFSLSGDMDMLFDARYNHFGYGFPIAVECVGQRKHHYLGIGFAYEMTIEPEYLGNELIGNSVKYQRAYVKYELMASKESIVNFGLSIKAGGYFVGAENRRNRSEETDNYANIGVVIEIGAPWIFLRLRPAVEYRREQTRFWNYEYKTSAMIGIRKRINTKDERWANRKKAEF
jgi:hypothetical protein